MQQGLEPPVSVADLVVRWCPRPLAQWGLELGDGALGDGDRLIIDGELTETCRDWAVASPDVVGELLESRFMADVRTTCRGMGARGQELYVALRRLLVDEPVLSGPAFLQHKIAFRTWRCGHDGWQRPTCRSTLRTHRQVRSRRAVAVGR